jgi:hypothetical protein
MNVLEQARQLLAKQKLETAERCKVTEATPEDLAAENAPVAEAVVDAVADAVVEKVPENPKIYANTLVLLEKITFETLFVEAILAHHGAQFANIVARKDTLMSDIYEVLDRKNNGVAYTRIVTNFLTLTSEQFRDLLNKYPDLSIVFVSADDESVVNIALEAIGMQHRTSFTRTEGSFSMQIASVLPFRDRFATEEMYTAFVSNADFQENFAFIAKNEHMYYKGKMVEFVNKRLLPTARMEALNDIFVAYKFSQLNRFTANHCLYNDNTIVSDYPYNDVVDYTNFVTSLTAENDEKKKRYPNATALVCFTQNYGANECNATIVSWTAARTAELRSRIGDCGHQELTNNVTALSVTFKGTQQEFIHKYLVGGGALPQTPLA